MTMSEFKIEKEEALERFDGDVELYNRLFVVFCETLPELMAKISDSVARLDPKLLERSAHTLKGGAAEMGIVAIRDLARELEFIGKSGDVRNAHSVLLKLEEAVAELNKYQIEETAA